jgi:hypothetical protein
MIVKVINTPSILWYGGHGALSIIPSAKARVLRGWGARTIPLRFQSSLGDPRPNEFGNCVGNLHLDGK